MLNIGMGIFKYTIMIAGTLILSKILQILGQVYEVKAVYRPSDDDEVDDGYHSRQQGSGWIRQVRMLDYVMI